MDLCQQSNVFKSVQVLIPKNYQCYLTKGTLIKVIKLKTLKWRDYTRLTRWNLNAITKVFVRGRQESLTQRRTYHRKRQVREREFKVFCYDPMF